MAQKNTGNRVRTKKSTAEWLEKTRAVTGKSKAAFARFIGISPQNYHHLSNGTAYPNFEVIAVLKTHGYNVDELLQK